MEKNFHVDEDWLFMDIFNVFASRDVDLEAIILAENELEVASEINVENIVVTDEEVRTPDADEVMEDVTTIMHEYTLSKVEFFYLDCKVKNPKDIWNVFTVIDNDNFDFSKLASLLTQKSKNYFLLEKGKGNARMCFGLKLTEDIVFKNWLNRKQEQLNLWSLTNFQEL